MKDWITIPADQAQGAIDAKQEKEVNFTINIPANADPGGHYAAIFAKQVVKTPSGATQLGVANRVGALVLVSVPGIVTKTAEITQFSYPKVVWKTPTEFTMKVKNTGTVHYDSKGQVELKSLLGKVQTVDVGTHTVIPQNSRNYAGTWTKKYPFGYYKLTASAVDGNGSPVTSTGVLWAIPLIIVIPIFIVLVVLIWLIIYLRRHVKFK